MKHLLLLLFLISLAAGQGLPTEPQAKHQFSKKTFFFQVAALAGSAVADGLTTAGSLDRGGYESNPIYGRHPSVGKRVGISLGFFVGETSLLYFTEHSPKRWFRWVGRGYVDGETVGHIYGAFRNVRVCPNGCQGQ